MATEFICTIGASGCDFTSPITWEDTMDENYHSVGAGNIASARYRVYSHGTVTGTLDAADVVTGGTPEKTATVVFCTATQVLLVHDTDAESFASSDTITSASGSTTLSNSGDTVILVGEIDGEVEITAGFTFVGFTTSATNKIILRSIDATKRSASSALRYGSGAGRILHSGEAGRALYVYEDYVDIEDIDITCTNALNTDVPIEIGGQGASNAINFRRVVVRGVGGATNVFYVNDADAIVVVDNCIIYGSSSYVFRQNNGTSTLRYCTLYTTAAAGYGCYETAGTVTATNCYANRGSSSGAAYTNITLTTCASSDATGSAGLQNIAASTSAGAYFTSLDSGTEDFRIQSSSELIDVGTTVSGLTTDIFGLSRPNGEEDVCAMEFIEAGQEVSGAITLPAVEVAGEVTREITATGAITLAAVSVSGGTGNWSTGAITLPAITVAGAYIQAPSDLYCNNDPPGAQSGDTNPHGITDTTPNFSAVLYKLAANITHVEIQVSAPGDSDFSEELSWGSGWLELETPISVSATRMAEDITYGQT